MHTEKSMLKLTKYITAGICSLSLTGASFAATNEAVTTESLVPEILFLEPQEVVQELPASVLGIEADKSSENLTEKDYVQIECLARNMYFEARGEGEHGQIAVSNVVLNRVKDDSYPSNACNVIHQRWKNTCQFSWVCKPDRIRNQTLYQNMLDLAENIYIGDIEDVTNGALYFHATSIRPRWAHQKRKTFKIGRHVFYKG